MGRAAGDRPPNKPSLPYGGSYRQTVSDLIARHLSNAYMESKFAPYPVVKVRGQGGGLSPLLPFEPPAIV